MPVHAILLSPGLKMRLPCMSTFFLRLSLHCFVQTVSELWISDIQGKRFQPEATAVLSSSPFLTLPKGTFLFTLLIQH